MKLLLPIIFAVVGLGVGLGAGVFFAPEPEPDPEGVSTEEGMAKPKEEAKEETSDYDENGEAVSNNVDYIKLNNQFIVPLVEKGQVVSLVVLSLSLEVDPGNEEWIYEREPKIRDAFLRVLFDHANAGGFSGDFTNSTNMIVLRDSLQEIARRTLGDMVQNVLIIDLVRQDM